MATKDLQGDIRKRASFWGALLAIFLRILFIIIIILIGQRHIILINIVAGILLLKISLDLLNGSEESHNIVATKTFASAVKTILLADVIMSLDNAIVIATVAEHAKGGQIEILILIIIALFASFPVILFGSNLLTKIIDKYKIILYVCSFILVHVSLELIIKDHLFTNLGINFETTLITISLYILSFVLVALKLFYEKKKTNN